MIVKSRLIGQLRRPQNSAQRKALANRDFLRRQQNQVINQEPEPPFVNYVARLDGFSQHWPISQPMPVSQGEDFKLELSISTSYGVNSNWISVFSGLGFNVWFSKSGGAIGDIKIQLGPRVDTGILWREGLETGITIERIADEVSVSYDNQVHSYTDDRAFYISDLCSYNGGDYLDGYVKELKLTTATGVVELPLTNKEQGATQLATVGSVNATMINYTEDVWEVVP